MCACESKAWRLRGSVSGFGVDVGYLARWVSATNEAVGCCYTCFWRPHADPFILRGASSGSTSPGAAPILPRRLKRRPFSLVSGRAMRLRGRRLRRRPEGALLLKRLPRRSTRRARQSKQKKTLTCLQANHQCPPLTLSPREV